MKLVHRPSSRKQATKPTQPISLKIPKQLYIRLKEQKITTGRSIQATVIAALDATPPVAPPLSADVEYWISVKEQKLGLSRTIILDRLLYWLMRHETETKKEVT